MTSYINMECALPVGEMYVPTSSLMMFENAWECVGECSRMFETL